MHTVKSNQEFLHPNMRTWMVLNAEEWEEKKWASNKICLLYKQSNNA